MRSFDHISHEFILNRLGQIPGRALIKQWLKAGYVEAEVFHETPSGTPQGGIISPLLANIALDGLDELLATYSKQKEYLYLSRWPSEGLSKTPEPLRVHPLRR